MRRLDRTGHMLTTGLTCLLLTAAGCAGTTDDTKNTGSSPTTPSYSVPPSSSSSSPTSSTSPFLSAEGFDCTKLVTKQEIEAALKKPAAPDKSTNKPPQICSYSSGSGLISIEHLPDFPIGQGLGTFFEGHTALRNDSTKKTPPSCALFAELGDSGDDTLGVTVRNVENVDMCKTANDFAHLAFTRLPQVGS